MPASAEQLAIIRAKKFSEGKNLGGRPVGSKTKINIEKDIAKKNLDLKILAASDQLFIAQASIALGQQFLYKIEKYKETVGKNTVWRSKPPKLVTRRGEIENYLTHLVDLSNGDIEDEHDPSATYYYITTKEPNNEALKDLFNRVHGKPKESVEHTGEVKFSLKGLAERRKQLRAGEFEVLPSDQK